ncbi:hypothetical protein FIBSPDRAFT_881329 [Athelia psychrophila]|uniref:Uncharacterized protein n=1 Tax=Athelia psychrophila TaxID=1759441 RepID=A0A166WJ64_9AGAM|nr:hypothetical protein FIBSPDRAFT_881329 [Fibularhizoctonia sp. CBS 109695]
MPSDTTSESCSGCALSVLCLCSRVRDEPCGSVAQLVHRVCGHVTITPFRKLSTVGFPTGRATAELQRKEEKNGTGFIHSGHGSEVCDACQPRGVSEPWDVARMCTGYISHGPCSSGSKLSAGGDRQSGPRAIERSPVDHPVLLILGIREVPARVVIIWCTVPEDQIFTESSHSTPGVLCTTRGPRKLTPMLVRKIDQILASNTQCPGPQRALNTQNMDRQNHVIVTKSPKFCAACAAGQWKLVHAYKNPHQYLYSWRALAMTRKFEAVGLEYARPRTKMPLLSLKYANFRTEMRSILGLKYAKNPDKDRALSKVPPGVGTGSAEAGHLVVTCQRMYLVWIPACPYRNVGKNKTEPHHRLHFSFVVQSLYS